MIESSMLRLRVHYRLDDDLTESVGDLNAGSVGGEVSFVPGVDGTALQMPNVANHRVPVQVYPLANDSFVVSAWVRMEDEDSWFENSLGNLMQANILTYQTGDFLQGFILGLTPATAAQPVRVYSTYDPGNINNGTLAAELENPYARWIHVAASVDVTAKTRRLYVDGSLAAEAAMNSDQFNAAEGFIGTYKYSSARNGSPQHVSSGIKIDDLKIFIGAATDQDIAKLAERYVVAQAPSIDTQPVSQTVVVGDDVSFSVLASGDPTLTFQWKKNGEAIDGATTANLTLSDVQVVDQGSYTVEVRNSVDTVTSDVATLSVHLAGDLDGDGEADLLWRNRSTGERTYAGRLGGSGGDLGSMSNEWRIAEVEDFNADGENDLLWQNLNTGERAIWVMSGASYTGTTLRLPTVDPDWLVVGSGDFNRDGSRDLVWQNLTTGERAVWLMDGATFSGNSLALPPVPSEWTIAGVADFNGDTHPDLIWRHRAQGSLVIWLMESGVYQSGVDLGSVSDAWTIAQVGDFDGDGDPDIAWTNSSTGEAALWLMQGPAFGAAASIEVPAGDWELGTAVRQSTAAPSVKRFDMDGNGSADILWRNSSTGEVGYWLMVGPAYNSYVSLGLVPADWEIATVADFNSDGSNDLLWQNTSNGQRVIWLMNDGAFSASVTLPSVDPTWRIAGAGDFDGDGDPDIFWQNTSTGLRDVWIMDGTLYTDTFERIGTVPTEWVISDVADLDADGKPDLIWRNTSTGMVAVWLLDGVAFKAGFELGAIPTEWQLAQVADYTGDSKPDFLWRNTSDGQTGLWQMDGYIPGPFVGLPNVGTEWRGGSAYRP